MKNLILKSFSIIIIINLSIVQSCQKDKNSNIFQKCDLSGDNIVSVENKTATLIYTDLINETTVDGGGFFLINSNVQEINLPLKVCNFPTDKFPSLKTGDSIEVRFDGKIELLPETVDATHLTIELKNIKTI